MAEQEFGKIIKGKKKLDDLDGAEEFLVQDSDGISYVVTVNEVAQVNLNALDTELLFDNEGITTGTTNVTYNITTGQLDVAGDLALTVLTTNAVPYVETTGILTSSDAMVDSTTKAWTFAHTITVPGGSIDVGDVITLSEGITQLLVHETVNDTNAAVVSHPWDTTGSLGVTTFDLDLEEVLSLQTTDTTNITTNPLSFNFTATAARQANTITLRTFAAMTNARAKVTHNASGVVVKYIPSKAVWTNGTGGLDLISGDNMFDFITTDDNTPPSGTFYLGLSPFRLTNGDQYDIEIAADAIALKGNVSEFPYMLVDVQDGTNRILGFKEYSDRVQVTGLLEGSVLSQASATTVDWTSGRGQVIDYTDPENPIVTDVTWDAVTGYTPTNLATDGTTVFGYDSTGSLVEVLTTTLDALDTKDYILFGSATHLSSTIITALDSPGNLGYDGIGSFNDFFNLVIGPANITGNMYGANGSNLSIDVIGGQAYILGSNFRTDPKLADIVTLPSDSPVTFLKVYREADPGLRILFDGASTTFIDPTQYDDGSGTLQTVSAGNWTIQRIFRSRNGNTFVAYGQQEFTSKSEAIGVLGNESFEEKSPLPLNLLRASLVVDEGATDLSLVVEAEFFEQSSFRSGGLSGTSTAIPGVTNPGGFDASVQFNASGLFGGDSNFTYDGSDISIGGETVVSTTNILTSNFLIKGLGTSSLITATSDNTQGIFLGPSNEILTIRPSINDTVGYELSDSSGAICFDITYSDASSTSGIDNATTFIWNSNDTWTLNSSGEIDIISSDTLTLEGDTSLTLLSVSSPIIMNSVMTVSQDGRTLGTSGGTLNISPGGNNLNLDAVNINLVGGTQDYTFSHTTDNLNLQSQDSGVSSFFDMYTADGDGTDEIGITLYHVGLPGATGNFEALFLGSESNEWWIQSESGGTGTLRDLRIGASLGNPNQIQVDADGAITLQSNGGADIDILSDGDINLTATGTINISGFVTTADILTDNVLLVGNGSSDITALDSGTLARISAASTNDALIIRPNTNTNAEYILTNSTDTEKLRVQYQENFNTTNITSAVDLMIEATTGAVNLSTVLAGADVNIDSSGGMQFFAVDDVNIEADGADLTLSTNTGDVIINSAGAIDVDSAGNYIVDAVGFMGITGGQVEITSGSTLNIISGGTSDLILNAGDDLIVLVADTTTFTQDGGLFRLLNNNANITQLTGMTIEQQGTGDAVLHFDLTGVQDWTMGIDNSQSNNFCIEPSASLGTAAPFVIDASNGNIGIKNGSPATSADLEIGDNTEQVQLRLSGTSSQVTHTVLSEYDLTLTRLTNGSAIIDFAATTFDGTSAGIFRFASPGTTGNVQIILTDPLGGTSSRLSTGTDSFVNATQGNMFGIGTSAPTELVHVQNSAGDVTFLLEGDTGNALHTINNDYDIVHTTDSGAGIMAFVVRPDDNTSNATYRFGLDSGGISSGSTGRNAIELYEANDITVNVFLSSSAFNSYVNAQGGFFGIGHGAPNVQLHVESEDADTIALFKTETIGANGGVVDKFVGNRDPNGNVTGSGGSEYNRDSGETSGSYESLEATLGTEWFKRSILPPNTKEIHSVAEYEALASGGVITITVPTTFILRGTFDVSSRIEDTGGLIITGEFNNNAGLNWSGTGTFWTMTGAISSAVMAGTTITSTSTGTFIDYQGTSTLASFRLLASSIVGFDDLGTISNGAFLFGEANIAGYGAPLKIIDCIVGGAGLNALFGGRVLEISNTDTTTSTQINISRVSGSIVSFAPLIRIDPFVGLTSSILLTNSFMTTAGINLFDTTGGTSGTFSSTANNSSGAQAVTSVTDNGGIARFNTASTPFIGSSAVLSTFSESTYNGTFVVTAMSVNSWFECGVDHAGGDTGSWEDFGIDVVALSHGLFLNDTVYLNGDTSTAIDGGYSIYNVSTNEFTVAGIFDGTDTGTFDTSGLDQTNSQVLSFQSSEGSNSHYIATAFVNNNTQANGAIINGVFSDMTFGLIPSIALNEGSTIERWKLIDPVIGLFEYTGNEPFDGLFTFDFTSESSGGAVDFRFKMKKSKSTTITADTIAFVDSDPDTITDSGNGFLTAGFVPGDKITVSGSVSNDGDYSTGEIASVSAGTIVLAPSDTLTGEIAGATVTIIATFGNLVDDVEALATIGSDAESTTKTFPLKAVKGDQIKPAVTRDSGTSGITHRYATFYSTQ